MDYSTLVDRERMAMLEYKNNPCKMTEMKWYDVAKMREIEPSRPYCPGIGAGAGACGGAGDHHRNVRFNPHHRKWVA